MNHVFYFITASPSLDDAAFHHYWRETHGPIVARIPQLRRYIQSHKVEGSELNCSYDGCAEAWVDDLESLAALQESAEYREGALADEPNFIDMDRVEWLVTRDRVMLDGPQTEDQVKAITRVRRKAGISVEAFRDHWGAVHGPIACALPGIQRYVQSMTVDEAYRYGEPRWDGVAQIWVESFEALRTLRESEEYTVNALDDARKFLDVPEISGFAAEEVQVIWPGAPS